ncbi:hypothetical protein PLICRDRAFT_168675 [Plicaturopsis crispa FD-325 SS-3]|uniref:MARVEL domain-containing protein n=1 Tax=Plicaturopsis crispa FD-325 SS-3 TaxID=944288 RepID=A0A0C9SQI1_PLICR|nr:hypothetical protein PLICRDRAFT_168675 [Plicaturopsis crispa FD-325 SS-3]
MAFDLPVFRVFLYLVLIVFSLIELGLTAARIQYTTHLPRGDPLNNGHSFYDPVAAELLATSILSILWGIFAARTIHGRYEQRYISTFAGELLGLFVLFLLWIVGAGITASIWGDLRWCHIYKPCRIITALEAFAWLSWLMVLFLTLLNLGFSIANAAFGDPMHGRWDPRRSEYGSSHVPDHRHSQGTYPPGDHIRGSQVAGAPAQPEMRDQSGLRRFVPSWR